MQQPTVIQPPQVDWIATGKNLAQLRVYDDIFKRNVCRFLNPKCDFNCASCTPKSRLVEFRIEQAELADVFHVSTSVIANWESGRTQPSVETMLLYQKLCEAPTIDALLIFSNK